MSHIRLYLALVQLIICTNAFTQTRRLWDGGAGTNLWAHPSNWTANTFPSTQDTVILDNTWFNGSYTVQLPNTQITVRYVIISPSPGNTIELILPNTNTLVPGFVVNGPFYGITLNAGGVFTNASGATSGNAIEVHDSIRVNNGGRVIHRSASSHTITVQTLSTRAGTETGTFVFEIPTASSTISLSGRTFGNLVLSANAATNRICNYTAAGVNRVWVRGNINIGRGVNLSLSLDDTIMVEGSYFQDSGVVNLGTTDRSATCYVRHQFQQSAGAVITESGTSEQSVVLDIGAGSELFTPQTWTNQVALVKRGPGAASLQSTLTLPHKLVLSDGVIVPRPNRAVTLQAGCTLEVDSLGTGFVRGGLRKEGLANSSFLFPVGDLTRHRWLRLENATGSFTIDYVRNNPRTLSSTLGPGLHHVSELESWFVSADGGSTARVKMSFVDPYSGGVTNISDLRVAQLVSGVWQNAGNTAFNGNPSNNGWILSNALSNVGNPAGYFTLAGASAIGNPLPLAEFSFQCRQQENLLHFQWKVHSLEFEPEIFEIQESDDAISFHTLFSVAPENFVSNYNRTYEVQRVAKYYRVRSKNFKGHVWYESAPVKMVESSIKGIRLPAGNIVQNAVQVCINSANPATYLISVYDLAGRIKLIRKITVREGSSYLSVPFYQFQAGEYIMHVGQGDKRGEVFRLRKN